MKRRDPFDEFALLMRAETASTLGLTGKRLQKAVAALVEFDAGPAGRSPERREVLLQQAGDALYAYVVQKELIGITDNDTVTRVYGLTPEIWQRAGAMPAQGAH